MQITTFHPFIATADVDGAVKLFEELGFVRRHTKKGIVIADREDTIIRMKNEGGFYIDVLQPKAVPERDLTGIRVNVDDLDEAYQKLLSHGFKNAFGDATVDTQTSKAAMMVAPSGFTICLIKHKKD